MSEWDQFRASIQNDTKIRGVADFRNFGAVITTMYAGDGYWGTVSKYVPKDVQDTIRKNIVDPRDFYTIASQYYNIQMFLKMSSTDITKIHKVIEFGGGIGSMAHIFYLLGFTGSYTIYDLPEVSTIQQYYLNSVKLSKVKLVTTVPNDVVDLFIGCWSISEAMPRPNLLDFKANEYWIAFQRKFDDVDNLQYIKGSLSNTQYVQCPHHGDSRYLVGKP